MIEAKNGHAIIKGKEDEILNEYSAITGRVLQDILSTNRVDLEIGEMRTAFDDSKLSSRKTFYEVIEMIAKREKEESV